MHSSRLPIIRRGVASAQAVSSGCNFISLVKASEKTRATILANDFGLYYNYISELEHDLLVKESLFLLRKISWSQDHFDSVISNYREVTPKNLHYAPTIKKIFESLVIPQFFNHSTDASLSLLPPHILELAPDGYIRPHLDSYCGLKIVGISLLSERTMRFSRQSDPEDYFEALLPPRSLYFQTGAIRREYEHEIKPPRSIDDEKSQCQSPSANRISIIFRERE